jgi:AAA family ATP:ADP antiporter
MDETKTGSAGRAERWLAFALRPFARVEPSEAVAAVVMTATVFLLLTAYYLVKTAREPLILLHGGAEVKQYAAGGQALLLVGVVRAYSWLATRVGTRRLLVGVFLFFVSNLVLFAVLAQAGVVIGVPFFLWVGVFNMTAVSQFWTLAADVYTPEQGKRLFAVLGIGASTGAVAGAHIAEALAPLGPAALIGAAAGVLRVCTAVLGWVAGRAATAGRHAQVPPDEPVESDRVLALLVRNRYLLLIAALTLLLNWVRSNGDYVLDRTLLGAAAEAKAHGANATVFVTSFKAHYFQWVNLVGMLLQLFLVSRIMQRAGVGVALLVLPVVAFAESSVFLFVPLLTVVLVGKVGESGLEYSLQNTARQALFLDASRTEKYIGKTAIDTVVVRAGDALTAVAILAASRAGLPLRAFVLLNLGLIVLWILVVLGIDAENRRRSARHPGAPGNAAVANDTALPSLGATKSPAQAVEPG